MTALEIAKRILADLVTYPELRSEQCLWSIHHFKGAPVLDYSPLTVAELKTLCEAIARPEHDGRECRVCEYDET